VRGLTLAAGLLLPFISIASRRLHAAARGDGTAGMTLVAIVFSVALVALWLHARGRSEKAFG